MMFKHHIGDVPKSISDLFQTNNNYHSCGTLAHKLYELLWVEEKQWIKLSHTLDRWLGIIYLVKFQGMYRIFI